MVPARPNNLDGRGRWGNVHAAARSPNVQQLIDGPTHVVGYFLIGGR